MTSTNNDIELIMQVVHGYFNGTYHGDTDQLKKAFHTDARITGVINGEPCDWSLTDFIARVTIAPTAAEKNEKYDKEIISIDVTTNAAMVKTRVVVAGLIFTDYITFLKIGGQWIIRNKSFTN